MSVALHTDLGFYLQETTCIFMTKKPLEHRATESVMMIQTKLKLQHGTGWSLG